MFLEAYSTSLVLGVTPTNDLYRWWNIPSRQRRKKIQFFFWLKFIPNLKTNIPIYSSILTIFIQFVSSMPPSWKTKSPRKIVDPHQCILKYETGCQIVILEIKNIILKYYIFIHGWNCQKKSLKLLVNGWNRQTLDGHAQNWMKTCIIIHTWFLHSNDSRWHCLFEDLERKN
jgi:hypothetical protein